MRNGKSGILIAAQNYLHLRKQMEDATAACNKARTELEAVMPPGTVVPEDFPVYWCERQNLVYDLSLLADEFKNVITTVSADIKKLHAYAELRGEYPEGVTDITKTYALQVRKQK